MKKLIQVDHDPAKSRLILTYKVVNGKHIERKSVIDREDALEVAKAIGWSGDVGEIKPTADV